MIYTDVTLEYVDSNDERAKEDTFLKDKYVLSYGTKTGAVYFNPEEIRDTYLSALSLVYSVMESAKIKKFINTINYTIQIFSDDGKRFVTSPIMITDDGDIKYLLTAEETDILKRAVPRK
jgi:hypothetical protein